MPPSSRYSSASTATNPPRIEAFDFEVGIDAGVVVSRLKHDALLKHEWQDAMRTRYVWATGTGDAASSHAG
jgi:hypothetical protein